MLYKVCCARHNWMIWNQSSIYHFAVHINASLLPQEIDATQPLFVLSLCAALPVHPVVDIKAQVLLLRVPPLLSEVDHRLSGLIHIQKQIIHFSKLTFYSSCPSPLHLSAADLSISVCAMTPSSTESGMKTAQSPLSSRTAHQTDHLPVSDTTAHLSGIQQPMTYWMCLLTYPHQCPFWHTDVVIHCTITFISLVKALFSFSVISSLFCVAFSSLNF